MKKEEILKDYLLVTISRQLSILGRKEALGGKAKFAILGDGKEVAQVALAKTFRKGDWRSGYYRDQTLMLALGLLTPMQFFAQLYGETDLSLNPDSGGRLMNNHFGTRNLDDDGKMKNLMEQINSSADISPTSGQMPRLLGLAYASKLFRKNKSIPNNNTLTSDGNEVAFGTIGESSTSEGIFFETINAASVLQVPLAISIWDDGWGISVPKSFQTTKESISMALKGFEKEKDTNGILIYKAKGWDYDLLCETFNSGIEICRKNHIPVLFHIDELTQPSGHSSSGSHERYKSVERLKWEQDFDCIKKMKEWIVENGIANKDELSEIETNAYDTVKKAKEEAWLKFLTPIKKVKNELIYIVENKSCKCKKEDKSEKLNYILKQLKGNDQPLYRDVVSSAKKVLRHICYECKLKDSLKSVLTTWIEKQGALSYERYSSHLYSESPCASYKIQKTEPVFNKNAQQLTGREILRENFDALFSKHPMLVTFGEDTGKLGDVNLCLEGLQEKYGELRVTDTGIRETTIIGQAIGLALRGFRPIAEIEYLDYLLYAMPTLSDDLATLRYRTKAGQCAPVIIRTRGHRLEGVWHSGSPMAMLINSLRGIYICTPRNMTQAAGFYNTLLDSDDPALVIEPLNGYRVKELLPSNLGEFKTPLGVPEILVEGNDLTLCTYGPCVRIAYDAIQQLKEFDIHCELIDVQTLMPFDLHQIISKSIEKTNRVLFFDEDVPGGATAYMMQQVIEKQGAYKFLDSAPVTLSAKEHRPAYGSDGDYFSNPNAEDVFDVVYKIMNEVNLKKYPL